MNGACGCRILILLSIGPPRPFLPTRSFLPFVPPPFPPSLLSVLHLPRVPEARSHKPAQTPPRERGGGHHARGCAGSRRLPPQRPARALPRPGPHAPILKDPLGGVGGRSAKRREEAPKAVLLPQWPELIEMRREGWRPSFYGAAAANEVPFRSGGIRYESGTAWC